MGMSLHAPALYHPRAHTMIVDLGTTVCHGLSDAETKAYFLGFLHAFDAASTEDLTSNVAWHWYRDMREAIVACVSGDDGKHTAP